MLTSRHQFYRLIRGRIIHATCVGGLKGILRDGRIRPNPDGALSHGSSGRGRGCYVCQNLNAISVLDLKSADERDLFDRERPFQNWTGVFTYNHPTIVLVVNSQLVESGLTRGRELMKLPGRFIIEAEACYSGEIPVSWIREGLVVGARYRLIYRAPDLCSVLQRAEQVERFSRRKPLGMFGLTAVEDIEPGASPNAGSAGAPPTSLS